MTISTLALPQGIRRRLGLRYYRVLALVAYAAFGLAACGGGSGPAETPPPTGPGQPPPGNTPPPADPPAIVEFSANKAAYGMGERATLTVRFTGGQGRVEPDVGPVTSGTPVQTAALDQAREFTLVVESPTHPAIRRTLRLPVDYRNEYFQHPQAFRSVGHSATLADDGKVVLIGGSRGETTASAFVDVYDPGTGGFRRIGELATGREGHRATKLTDGRILVTGGLTANGQRTAELVDPRTGVATPTGAPVVQRLGHTATHLGNGRVLVVGGVTSGENAPLGLSNSAEIWDPATGQFRLLASRLTMRRANHGAVLLGNGRVLITGGLALPGVTYEAAEIFDPATETFTAVGSIDRAERGLQATALLPDGSVLTLGGETTQYVVANRVIRYDGTTLASTQLANLLRPRTFVEAEVSRDGRVFLFGGETGAPLAATETAESYTVANGPVAIASLPEPRSGHTVTRLKDGRFLIVGGENRLGQFTPAPLIYQ
jgi:hypothetical protein